MPTPDVPTSERFRYCSRCGSAAVRVESALCHRCTRCGYGHFINPIAGVAALLTDGQGRLLLLRRAHDPGKGKLGLPGGFVDVGETAEEALRREIREEIGIEAPALDFFLTLPNEYPYQGLVTPVLDLFYRGRVEHFAAASAVSEVDELVIRDPREVDLSHLAFASNAEAIRRLALSSAEVASRGRRGRSGV